MSSERCPFCLEKGTTTVNLPPGWPVSNEEAFYRAACCACRAFGPPGATEEIAQERWEKRASSETEGVRLENCPGCDAPARFVSFRWQIAKGYIKCDNENCGIEAGLGTATEAAKEWNERKGGWVPFAVCPNCGGADTEFKWTSLPTTTQEGVAVMACKGCGHEGPPSSSKNGARVNWNASASKAPSKGGE